MNIAVIHGQAHHGSTWHLTKLVLDRFPDAHVDEFFLPKDGPGYCVGCYTCFLKGEERCPHAAAVQPIARALEAADLIVMTSPSYVLDVSGQMKALLDHLGYRWMPHRPHPGMFSKLGLCVSTTAGAGSGRTMATMRKSLEFWGVAKVFTLGASVAALNWEGVKPKKKREIERRAEKLAVGIHRAMGRAKPGPKTRLMFLAIRHFIKRAEWNPADRTYWQAQGWLDRARPWR
jgi:multimeric flavodoxin WrbA